ncbi:imelysin family protein [Simiduia curdlanivorans]|uniref:Imelysin family protein n=1 Tax=Simiduia curdlanivorans TaxID=1492769 RepID=A0ABV8V363_9GAMM|nr:imelysin family protein [Simiduia curdlanivorans]MDN3637803.1 imelysin family protein [Simiduia curdlanivorans]
MRAVILPFTLFALALAACQDREATPKVPDAPAVPTANNQKIEPAVDQQSLAVWHRGGAALARSQAELNALRDSVQALLQNPTQATLNQAREQWHSAHNSGQAFSLFFAMGAAHPGLFVQLETLHDQLDGWPIQPGFLDYFDVYTHSGLVNDIAIPVTAKALKEAHQQFDPADRALGLHPIAYLLWGDKGQRPATDFVKQALKATGEDEPNVEDLANNRRRALLGLMVELAIDSLDKLAARWQETGVYSKVYTGLSAQQRSEILRTSSIYLIEEQLINKQLQPQLDAISQTHLDVSNHNQYSGGSKRLLSAQLNGLALLIEQNQSSALVAHWSQGASKSWLEQLAAANRVLDKLPEEGAATETQWVAAIAALQQLTLPLKAEVETL